MSRLRLVETLHRAPRSGSGLSSVWMVVLGLVLVQVLNDCFGWLADHQVRFAVGFIGGIVMMILLRLSRGSRH